MNLEASELKMRHSNFASSHGMYTEMNYSSCSDMAKLSIHLMSNSHLMNVVRKKSYHAKSTTYPDHCYEW